MIKVTLISQTKSESFSYKKGALLSEVIASRGIPFDMPCGGMQRCYKCKVQAQGELSPLCAKEQTLLTPKEQASHVRFACMAYGMGDVVIRLQNEPSGYHIVTGGYLPDYEKQPIGTKYGVAVDIGTTTVVVYLMNLETYTLMGQICEKNQQGVYGADVISRIDKSLKGQGNALASTIVLQLNTMINTLCKNSAIDVAQVDSGVITGNTAMLYLLCEKPVTSIAFSPFLQDLFFGKFVLARELGIEAAPAAQIYLPRCIGAYVGADITTAILSAGIANTQVPVVLIDIGTNGEMALYTKEKRVCCSTAAGPAFEGAGIYMGMAGKTGAIDTVRAKDGHILHTTIGNEKAIGICGSGIIDMVAVLLELEIVDETGRIEEEHPYLEVHGVDINGHLAIAIENTEVVITQGDIRAVQLAKASICGGMLTMIHEVGLEPKDIETVYIAGGFGQFISAENAEKIGLLPQGFAKKSKTLGNSAGMGAMMIVQSKEQLELSQTIAKTTVEIPLATHPYFNEKYVDCMMFE